MTTILLADDHSLVRETIAAYLTSKGQFNVKPACDLDEAMEVLSEGESIDLAIFDYQMPGMNGLDGLAMLKAQYPELKTAMMSGVAPTDVVDRALELGALAFFPKSMSVGHMVESIRQILADDSAESGEQNHQDPEECDDPNTNRFGLTPRETEILQMLALGKSNKLIADELELKEVTVKFHVSNVMTKLNVTNRTQAALLADQALAS